jgi:hypothetical protein
VNPTPSPVDVFIHSSPAEWWQIFAALGPLAVLLAAVIAAIINWRTLKQRTEADALSLEQKRESDANALNQKQQADDRAEWWKRAQWSLDSSLSNNPRRAELGLEIMAVLADSGLVGDEELGIITVAWEEPLEVAQEPDRGHGARASAEVEAEADTAQYDVDAGRTAAPRPASQDLGVQIAAAKLRLVTDRRLGKETPGWVKAIAAEKAHRNAS